MKNLREIQKEVFDFLIPYRNDDEQLSLPYLRIYENSISLCHFLYIKNGEEIKLKQEIVYDIMGNIHRQLLEEKYLLKDGIKIISKRTAIPKVYEYMDLILQNDFKIKDEDKLDKDTYFFAAGESLNGYLNIAKYFIDNFLR